MIDPILLATVRVSTFDGDRQLTAGTGFFFERGERVFLVTSRHVLADAASGHLPNRISVVVHVDPVDLTRTETVSIWLYKDGRSLWRQAADSGGAVDVAVIELDRGVLPQAHALHAFSDAHLEDRLEEVPLGAALLVVGFPLGFFDTRHSLPVARQAIVASAFGIRFQGQGYFLTDARIHRGASGAPVVLYAPAAPGSLPWKLLGIHSARLDMSTREEGVDETLGLNCAWYADILRTLTQ
jgi:S1-C subfamily serine protease